MTANRPTVDLDLRLEQIQDLSSRDAVAAFFSALGYDTSARTRRTPANLGITAAGLINQIRHAELLAGQDALLQVYLFELTSVTVAAAQGLARAFRNRAGNFLLVLTTRDYDRLDFVLLERYLPEGASPTALTGRQGAVRPRLLSVQRTEPGRVNMRVLRRFTCTEPDPLSQYEKLLSAYAIAGWSEESFNNRALFADYLLIERLPLEPEWNESTHDPYLALRDLFREARTRWAGKPGTELRQGLFEPALHVLGFTPTRVKPAASDAARPHYLLQSAGGDDLAVCLAYPWGRFLDGKDYQRDAESPEENPGALVLSLLQDDGVKWAVVTNGKHWRLYSARTHSRATNYYEVDLEETLAAQDSADLFRYFWLLFREKAFAPRAITRDGPEETTTFLDLLLDGSEEYARKLGESLKRRVFDDIFPHLAEGFIAYRRARHGAEADPSQEALDEVFQGTLTLLYRLLFLLYAEARDLLPVRETPAYHDVSLTRLTREIAQAAGDDPRALADRTRKAYEVHSAALYDRLLTLFRVVDRGDATRNTPVYNGGLFISEPDPDDESAETHNARFLLAHKVPDRYLATALDLLARDEDERTLKRVFIDYKSLGVRQLGRIYEGLLEFHLRLAPEKMAVCRGKKTEEVIPYREAVRNKRAILKEGRGRDARERTLPKGAVYLENTRHERKATGSYYTPDHIVKYLVQHTVGPVLEEKFRALEPVLREAQQAHRAAMERQQVLPQDDAEEIAPSDRDLVTDLFDVKVLDPAMGSGHFLVETVDFITDRMLDFLNGFPWNPVTARSGTLGETRRTVLREMDEQGITIDPHRLTDVNLLKRHVLERCIYGVDLNPMAVELAKASLWLDCFTLGAPLSFLDHHLKCGNSLIGAWDIDSQLAGEARRGELLQAISNHLRIGSLAGATSGQMTRSKQLSREAEALLTPAKRRFDVELARHFVDLGSGRAVARTAQQAYGAGAGDQSPRDRFELAPREAAARRFFHWELEFPEVWFAVRPGPARTVARKERGGFDAIVGNPPWGGALTPGETRYARHAFPASRRGAIDTFALFLELGLRRIRRDGRCGLLLPDIFLLKSYPGIRCLLLDESRIDELAHWGMPFAEVSLDACSAAFTRAGAPSDHRVLCYPHPPTTGEPNLIPQAVFRSQTGCRLNLYLTDELSRLIAEARSLGPRVADLFVIREGIHSGNIREKLFVPAPQTRTTERLIFGRDEIAPYRLRWNGRWVVYDEATIDRAAGEYANLGDEALHRAQKILVRRTGDRIIAALDREGLFASNNLFLCVPDERVGEPGLLYCLAVLNSAFATWYFRSIQPRTGRLFAELKITHLAEIPVPFYESTVPEWAGPLLAELADLLSRPCDGEDRLRLLHWSGRFAGLLQTAVRRVSPALADAVAAEEALP